MDTLQDVLDLLRTGTPPQSWGMTMDQWRQYKIDKAAGTLQRLINHWGQNPPLNVCPSCGEEYEGLCGPCSVGLERG